MSGELPRRRSSDELRRRFPELEENVCSTVTDHPSTDIREQSSVSSSNKNNRRINTLYKRFDLESLLWILICAVMMYYTDFWTTVMYDVRVKRTYFYASISLFTVAVVMMTYCMIKIPTLNYNNWSQEGPMIVPIMTVMLILGSLWLFISLIMSLWPIWGLITPIILFIVLMAFISLLVTVG